MTAIDAMMPQAPPVCHAATSHAVGRSEETRETAGAAAFAASRGPRVAPPAAGVPGTDPGLVICAISARTTSDTPVDQDKRVWTPHFPTADLVDAAASMLPAMAPWDGRTADERWRIQVSPGSLAVGGRDMAAVLARADLDGADLDIDLETGEIRDHAESSAPRRRSVRSVITEWSRRSRSRMVRRICEIDFSVIMADPMTPPAMLTVTYPGDWLTVAPSGEATKRHLRAFKLRWEREWGSPLVGLWKLEFQRRGAPHVHILTVPPTRRTRDGRSFQTWFSETWADVVAHPDPEQRRRHLLAGTAVDYPKGVTFIDPRRTAVYFAKHGTFADKEYQHIVPVEWQAEGCGPGRFWGYWGLRPTIAEVEVTRTTALRAARVLRAWSHTARGRGYRGGPVTRQVVVPRVAGGRSRDSDGRPLPLDQQTGKIVWRKTRRRVCRLANGRGWISLNDGPNFASQLARYLADEERRVPEAPEDRRWRLILATGETRR